MKKKLFISIFCGIMFFAGSLNAQDKYSEAMKATFGKLSSGESLANVSAQFERIAQAEQTKWLPYYYASYYTTAETFSLKDAAQKEALLDQAQKFLDATQKLQPDSSEIQVLQGFIHIARLSIDPVSRGYQYSQLAHEAYDKAIKINPSNPRAYYMKGMTILNTPDFFGGGKVPAKPVLLKASELYDTFKPAAVFYPDWGKDDCKKQLAACE